MMDITTQYSPEVNPPVVKEHMALAQTIKDVGEHPRRQSSTGAAGRLFVLAVVALTLPSSGEAFVTRPASFRLIATNPCHDSSCSTVLFAKGKRRNGQEQTTSQPEVRRSQTPTRGDTILHFRNSDIYQNNNLQLSKPFLREDGDRDDDKKLQWRNWLTAGLNRHRSRQPDSRSRKGSSSRHGNHDVKLREDKRLGGLPRAIGYSSSDWWHNILTLPSSGILKEIRSPVTFMLGWGTAIATLYHQMLRVYPIMASHMAVPVQPHSFVVSVLGLLLVFRTNSAYQRFVEGRKIWEDILSTSRDLFRMVSLFEASIGTEKKRNVSQLLAAFPYLLRHRIQPHRWMRKLADPSDPNSRDSENTLLLYDDNALLDNDYFKDDEEFELEPGEELRRPMRELCYVDKRTLPWRLLPKNAMEGCARAQNRPLFVCDRIAKELMLVKDDPKHSFTNRERMALLAKVDKLSHCIGQCERIHQTGVPLNYARHSLRSLSFWLLTLPFALVKDLGFFTGPMLAFMVRLNKMCMQSF
jgi:predicted membrane chloride channel (bestrophin family)